MQCIEIHCIPMDNNPMDSKPPCSAGHVATVKEDDNQPSQLDFAHFKRHDRGDLQVDDAERPGVPEYLGQLRTVKNLPTPATDGAAPERWPPLLFLDFVQSPAQVVHHNGGNRLDHQEVRTMSNCIACGAELEPPIRAPHTVYVKTLYRIAGQDYCRHHIIRAADGRRRHHRGQARRRSGGGQAPGSAIHRVRPTPPVLTPMYVITRHRPWASLIALGSKAVIKRADEVIPRKTYVSAWRCVHHAA